MGIHKEGDVTTFLDMNVRIQEDGEIKTTLHEKPMALYLFIPPHSAHPPGVLTGHIFGNILPIFRVNLDEQDMITASVNFFRRFLKRGNSSEIKSLILKAVLNARKFLATSTKQRAAIILKVAEAAR